uniref:Uncharacterized protein n=1 Tax=Anguilla anguilla TaxID=7936 RepID=A0A0E9U190_ANGAN
MCRNCLFSREKRKLSSALCGQSRNLVVG